MTVKTSAWDNGNNEINVENLTENTVYSLYSGDTPNKVLIESLQKICGFHCSRTNITNITNIEYCYNRQSILNNTAKLKLIFFVENRNENCLICTDIDSNAYKYKKFNNDEYSLKIYRQTIGKHICIDPNMYIYSNNQDRVNSLDIYIYANESIKSTKEDFSLSENLPLQIYVMEKLNYAYYNDVLYNGIYTHGFIDNIILHCKYGSFSYELLNSPEIDQSDELIRNELKSMINTKGINRFTNRFVYTNAFDKITCKWIMNEYLNKKHGNYISDLSTFPMAYNYTMFTITNYILPHVNKCYNIDTVKYTVNIFEAQILNVTNSFDVNIVKNQNNNNFSINIVLSDTDDKYIEYFKFKDGSSNNIKQGDAIIFYTDLKCKKYNQLYPLYILNIQFNMDMEITPTDQRVL